MAAQIRVYRTYRFIDKDPVIDKMRTMLKDVGLDKKGAIVSELSGVSASTLANWFEGATKRPQYASIAAVTTAVGFELTLARSRGIDDLDAELKKARDWRARQKKANGNGKGK